MGSEMPSKFEPDVAKREINFEFVSYVDNDTNTVNFTLDEGCSVHAH